MTTSTEYGMATLLRPSSIDTFSKKEPLKQGSLCTNLVRIKKFVVDDEGTKVYISPLPTGCLKTLKEAKTIFDNYQFCTLHQAILRGSLCVVLTTSVNNASQMGSDLPVNEKFFRVPKDLYVICEEPGKETFKKKVNFSSFYHEDKGSEETELFTIWQKHTYARFKAANERMKAQREAKS